MAGRRVSTGLDTCDQFQISGVGISTVCRSIYDSLNRHDQLPLLALIEHVRDMDLPTPVVTLAAGAARAA